MEGLVLVLGIICCLQIGWNDAATVRVNKAIYAKVGDKVALECYGSEDRLGFYIGNRAAWSYTEKDGTVTQLTEGFYPFGPVENLFAPAQNAQYQLDYDQMEEQKEYRFRLNITAVKDADDGYYKCSLLDDKDNVTDSKMVKLTVVHRVEKVKIEILGMPPGVAAESSTPLTQGDHSIQLTPGRRQVRCTAYGSNPSPVLEVMYNQMASKYTMEGQKDTTGSRVKYTTSFTKDIEFSIAAGEQQTLTCNANTPHKQFNTKSAGLKLKVAVERPEFHCGNMSASVGNNYRTFTCNLTASDGTPGNIPSCNKVNWMAGENMNLVHNNQKVKDKDLDIMEMACKNLPSGKGIETTLTLYKVKDIHFSTDYYVQYGEGEGAHRHPVILNLAAATAGAAIITPVSLLLSIVASLVAGHLAKL